MFCQTVWNVLAFCCGRMTLWCPRPCCSSTVITIAQVSTVAQMLSRDVRRRRVTKFGCEMCRCVSCVPRTFGSIARLVGSCQTMMRNQRTENQEPRTGTPQGYSRTGTPQGHPRTAGMLIFVHQRAAQPYGYLTRGARKASAQHTESRECGTIAPNDAHMTREPLRR